MTNVSKYKIANYLSDEKGYAYKVAIDVAKDIEDYINDKIEEAQKEVFEKIYQSLKEIKVIENNCNGYLIIGAIQDLEEEFGIEVDV